MGGSAALPGCLDGFLRSSLSLTTGCASADPSPQAEVNGGGCGSGAPSNSTGSFERHPGPGLIHPAYQHPMRPQTSGSPDHPGGPRWLGTPGSNWQPGCYPASMPSARRARVADGEKGASTHFGTPGRHPPPLLLVSTTTWDGQRRCCPRPENAESIHASHRLCGSGARSSLWPLPRAAPPLRSRRLLGESFMATKRSGWWSRTAPWDLGQARSTHLKNHTGCVSKE